MKIIKGILFDLYGTVVDIETDEGMEEIYRGIAHYLTYQGVCLHRGEVRDRYYRIMKEQKEASREEYPEIDVLAIWNALLLQEGVKAPSVRENLSLILAHLYRAISRKHLQLYPGVKEVLDMLRPAYRMALLSDAQPCFALPEIRAMGLDGYFDPVFISVDCGFRKPDRRSFGRVLDIMNLRTEEVIFVGNDMYRDIYGAGRLGIRTIFFDSNQGTKSHENTSPDFVARRFEDVLQGVERLSDGGAVS
jgi:putative hydrolase of the HAD superfamily